MTRRLARLLVRLYPRAWRERYGTEFEALLESESGGLRAFGNVLRSAVTEHIFPTRGRTMDEQPISFEAIRRQPSAFLPILMSLTALLLVLASILTSAGVERDTDEGTVAHLWQILMAGQMPIVLFFAIRWLPRAPRRTLMILGLQVAAGLASMAPVFFLGL